MLQQTLKKVVVCSDIGLHTGVTVNMTISPADPDTGIVFVRSDVSGKDAVIKARWDRVVDTRMCTVIGNDAGVTVGTIEHLMSALAGCGVDNAIITLDNIEVPIMDGSAAPFVEAIERVGVVVQPAARRVIRILKPVSVTDGLKSASFTPAEDTIFSFDIDFDSAAIAHQSREVPMDGASFKSEIAAARTFGFLHEVEGLRKMGLARGGSLDNAVVISGDEILNEGGLRFGDEFVRHKILDAVGDLYLAGGRFIGHFHGSRSGHALNNQLLRAMFADSSAWCWETPGIPATSWPIEQRAVA